MTPRDVHLKSVGLIDLMCDASFAYSNSLSSDDDDYRASRHARSSIISSALCIECFIDCLINTIERPEEYAKLERMASLKKLVKCIDRSGLHLLDIESSEYAAVEDLIKLRNGFVHVKISQIEASITRDDPDSSGVPQWAATLNSPCYPALGLQTSSLAWRADDALKVLHAIEKFMKHVLTRFDPFSGRKIRKGFVSRFCTDDISIAFIPEECRLELERLCDLGINFLDLIDVE